MRKRIFRSKMKNKKDTDSLPISSIQRTNLKNVHPNSQIDFLYRNYGNCALQCMNESGILNSKLRIVKPGYNYEREAESVAEHVMNIPKPRTTRQDTKEGYARTKLLAKQITPLVQKHAEEHEDRKESVSKRLFMNAMLDQSRQRGALRGNRKQSEKEGTLHAKISGNGVLPLIERRLSSIKGSGEPLPKRTRSFFEPRFGVNFSNIRVHTDSNAAYLARHINAKVFTVGQNLFFGSGQYSPHSYKGKHVLAHELTHTVQQGGGDSFIQRYTKYTTSQQSSHRSLGWINPNSDVLKVADDGTMAVCDSGDDAWASSVRIATGESALKAIGSKVKLEQGAGTISGKVPRRRGRGRRKILKKVLVKNRVGGGRADLTADCGTAAREILGIAPSSEKFSAIIKRRGVERYTKAHKYYGNPYTTPDRWIDEILKKEFGSGLSSAALRARYNSLSARKKRRLDRKYGINRFAVPRVGQAITVNEPSGWNFHFAGVIMKGGPDYVTSENFPGSGRTSQSWYFEMYGPRWKRQTFYDVWKDTSGSAAMVVESEKARKGKTNVHGVHLSRLNGRKIATLTKGTHVFVLVRGIRWRKVKVTNGSHTGKIGWILSKYFVLR